MEEKGGGRRRRKEERRPTCRLLMSVRVVMGSRPQFSARASGTASSASAKALGQIFVK